MSRYIIDVRIYEWDGAPRDGARYAVNFAGPGHDTHVELHDTSYAVASALDYWLRHHNEETADEAV